MSFGRLGALGRGFGRLGGGSRKPAAVISATYTLTAAVGTFVLNGSDMAPVHNYNIAAGVGSFTETGNAVTLTYSGGASYTGPGDVVSSAYAWYGLRGYNAAYATGSNPALDLVDQAGANPLTVNILSNGRLDVASINTWVTANTVTTIKVTKWYDQSGNSRHVSQGTLSAMPVLNLTGFGSLPAIVFAVASAQNMNSSAVTQAQPLTASVVYTRGSASGVLVSNANNFFVRTASGALVLNAGTDTGNVGTAANGSWHAIHAIFNTTSSAVFIDGTATTGLSVGSNAYSSNGIGIGTPAAVAGFDGSMAEVGLWTSAFTTTGGGQADLINTNQHGSNGYSF